MAGVTNQSQGREWQERPDRSFYYTALIVTITLLVYRERIGESNTVEGDPETRRTPNTSNAALKSFCSE